jgi:hypothetical protein
MIFLTIACRKSGGIAYPPSACDCSLPKVEASRVDDEARILLSEGGARMALANWPRLRQPQ